MFTIIAAMDSKNGIGKDNDIPWHCPDDMKHFRKTTTNHIVIMGKTTFDTIGYGLPHRITCVISSRMALPSTDSIKVFRNPWDCVRWCQNNRTATQSSNEGPPTKYKRELFICGGASIYNWFYTNGLVGKEIITCITDDYNCDVTIDIPRVRRITVNEKIIRGPRYGITPGLNCKKKCNHCTKEIIIYYYSICNDEEDQVLDLMRDILETGDARDDRTGTGTLSLFGKHLEFDLTNNKFPLMTSRPMFFRGIFEELMLYLRGQTDSKILESKGVNVWKGNTSREFLNSRDLQCYAVGDMGHSYGFRFRHFGATYYGCDVDYTDVGYDQLSAVINSIKNNPTSRRHMISLWEPNNMHKAVLPPCLYGYQFYVANGMLTCLMHQRSRDLVVAGGWNIATGAILTILIANVCGLKPQKLIWDIGDAHIYNNVVEAAVEQVTRDPLIYPKLFLRNAPVTITDFEFKNLDLIGYAPLAKGNIVITLSI